MDLVVPTVQEPAEVSGLPGCGIGISDSFGSIEIAFACKGEPGSCCYRIHPGHFGFAISKESRDANLRLPTARFVNNGSG